MTHRSVDHGPVVSVIMSVYNGERYLREAIDSILAQKFTDFELLVIDDGSTDRTLEIVCSYPDPRIRVLAEHHRGLVSALNRGLAEARGPYIARMDADDVSLPTRLMKQVTFLEDHQDVVMVGSWARLIDEYSLPTGVSRMTPAGDRQLHVALCATNQFVHGSVMMRREAVLALRGYRPAFETTEDYDLWLRLAAVGKLANLAEPLYELRIHESSKTVNEGRKKQRHYSARAQRSTLEHYLHGLKSKRSSKMWPSLATSDLRQRSCAGLGEVTLSDWAQICLWQRHIGLSIYLLFRALASQPRHANLWSVVGPTYVSRARAWELSLAAQRLSRHVARRDWPQVARLLGGFVESLRA